MSELPPLEPLVIDHLINEELEREKIINQVYFRSCNSASLKALQIEMHCVQPPSHETIKTVIDNFYKVGIGKKFISDIVTQQLVALKMFNTLVYMMCKTNFI